MNHAITTLLFEASKMRKYRQMISDDMSIPESDKMDLIRSYTADILECEEAVIKLRELIK